MHSLFSKSKNPLPLLVLSTAVLQGLTIAGLIILSLFVFRLAGREPPSLVQISDGTALSVTPVPSESRTDATIRLFVSTLLYELLTWNGQIEDADGQLSRDPGVEIDFGDGETGRVATGTMVASLGLSEDFRMEMLTRLAQLTPSEVFTGRQQVIFVIDSLSQPEETAEGRWKLSMLAHLNVFDETGSLQKTIPFDRTVYLRAIHVPVVPVGETPIERAVYSIRLAGLEITEIHEFTSIED